MIALALWLGLAAPVESTTDAAPPIDFPAPAPSAAPAPIVAEPPLDKLPGYVPPAVASPPVVEDPTPAPVLERLPEPALGVEQPLAPDSPIVVNSDPPRPARAIRWRLDPFLDLGAMRVADPGYRAFHFGPNLFQLGAGIRVDARVRGPVFLGAGVRYGLARTSGGPYESALETQMVIHEPRALVRMSIVLLEGLDVIAQLDGGPAFARAAFSDGRNASAKKLLGAFDAKAGMSVYVPRTWLRARGAARITAGLDLLLGYGMRTQFDMRPRPDTASDDITLSGTRFGDVATRGVVFSIGVFVRVM